MKLDLDYVVDKLVDLLNIPSPSGNTKAIDFVEKSLILWALIPIELTKVH